MEPDLELTSQKRVFKSGKVANIEKDDWVEKNTIFVNKVRSGLVECSNELLDWVSNGLLINKSK